MQPTPLRIVSVQVTGFGGPQQPYWFGIALFSVATRSCYDSNRFVCTRHILRGAAAEHLSVGEASCTVVEIRIATQPSHASYFAVTATAGALEHELWLIKEAAVRAAPSRVSRGQ